MELEETWIIMENSWNFVKYDKTTSSQKTSCQTLVSFKFLIISNACIVYMHAVVAAFHIYAQHGQVELVNAKRGGWSLCIKLSWKLHSWSWKIMEKVMELCFEFLWEPCDSLYCKQCEPRQDCSNGISLIMAHTVCNLDKKKSEVNKNIVRIRVNQSLVCLWQFLLWWLKWLCLLCHKWCWNGTKYVLAN